MDLREISVFMPVFNRASVVGRAVDSVLAQSHRELELVVVDDGSTDETVAAVEEHQDPRLRVIRLPTNRGANAARNRGIEEARHPFVAFIDSDDVWVPEKLETQIRAYVEDGEQADVWFSPLRWHRDSGLRLVGSDLVGLPSSKLRRRLLEGGAIGTSSAIVRRNLLIREGGFDERLPRLQEWDLWIRLSGGAHFLGVPQPLVDAYECGGGISSDGHAQLRASRLILEKHFSLFADAGNAILSRRMGHLGHLEMLIGDTKRGRGLLWRSVMVKPTVRAVARATTSRVSPSLYKRVFARRRQ